jgi:hypothetical protein
MCVPERNTNEENDCNWLNKATLHMNCQDTKYTNPINLLKARGNYMNHLICHQETLHSDHSALTF